MSSIPSIAPGELLPSANSLESLSRQLAAIIGPTLGAILVATGGNGVAFAINALSFFISAACVLPILHIELPVVQSPRRLSFTAALCQMRDDLRAGFRAVTSSYWLWVTIVVAAFGNICIGAVRTIGTPLLVRELLAGNVTVLGFLTTVAAVAGIVAATIVGSIKRLRFRGIVYYVGYIVAGIGLVSMSIQMSVVGVLPGMVLLGAMPPVLGLIWTNTLQQNIPREKLGRVNSVDMLGSFALLPIGYGLVGWYGDLVGAARLFLAAGLVAVVLGLVGLSVREVRRLD